jgi:hypothetical protein
MSMWKWCAIRTVTRFRKIFDRAGVVFWGRVSLFGDLNCVMAIRLDATGAGMGMGMGNDKRLCL